MVIQTVILVSLMSYSAATMTNSWAVKLSGKEQVADILARKHGLVNLGQVSIYYCIADTSSFFKCTCAGWRIEKCLPLQEAQLKADGRCL